MKSSVIASIAFAAVVSAQAGLPQCATTCAINAIGQAPSCTPTDVACLCRNQGYLTTYASCVASSCSAADLQTATQVGLALCASAGVTITASPSVTGSVSASSLASSASSAASSAISSAISSLSSASSAASSRASSASSAASMSMTSMMSSASSHASSASSMASSASSAASAATSKAAAPTQGITWEVLGLAAAGVAALL